jgi:hypothetical protein
VSVFAPIQGAIQLYELTPEIMLRNAAVIVRTTRGTEFVITNGDHTYIAAHPEVFCFGVKHYNSIDMLYRDLHTK